MSKLEWIKEKGVQIKELAITIGDMFGWITSKEVLNMFMWAIITIILAYSYMRS